MESTLSLKFQDFLSEVGQNLGWGRGALYGDPAWTARREQDLRLIVQSGLRNVYWPNPPYEWSFMRPTVTITLTSGNRTQPLPHDFGGFEGEAVVTSTSSTNLLPVRVHDDTQVDFAYSQQPDITGFPRMVSHRTIRTELRDRGQRYELYVFPEPDATYTLRVKYYLLPDALAETHPYHYGGAMHAETFLESCLAVAEVRQDDMADGPHARRFMDRLAASIGMDRRLKPQYLGMNEDRSDASPIWRYLRNFGTVTFNGVTP